jgi:large subunit ribosomal protein L4
VSSVRNWTGGKVTTAEVDGSALGDQVKLRLLREVVRMYEANQRQGTLSTKTRGETNYTENKPYKQKGTGNARRGDRNSPLLRGGGVIFGPRPRDFGFALPRKALREALRSALSGKLRDGEVLALSSDAFTRPSTKTAASALKALGCDSSTCLVLPADHAGLWKSFRNIPKVSVVRASDLNAHQVLAHRQLVLVDDAWAKLTARLPGESRAGKARAARATAAGAQTAGAKKPGAPRAGAAGARASKGGAA